MYSTKRPVIADFRRLAKFLHPVSPNVAQDQETQSRMSLDDLKIHIQQLAEGSIVRIFRWGDGYALRLMICDEQDFEGQRLTYRLLHYILISATVSG